MHHNIFSLTITEQPSQHHRFRYPTELQNGKMGSLLHGSSEKSQPRVCIQRTDATSEVQLKLFCCTFDPDLQQHPYILHGDYCNEGIFQKPVVMRAGVLQEVVSLDRVCIVCPGRKAAALQDAWNKRRKQSLNFFNKPTTEKPPFGRNKKPNKIRLGFCLFAANGVNGETDRPVCDPVCTDCIENSKDTQKLEINEVFPQDEISDEIWLYLEHEIEEESITRYKIKLSNGISETSLPPTSVKKCLITFSKFCTDKPADWPAESEVLVTIVDMKLNVESEGKIVASAKFLISHSSQPAKRSRPNFQDDIDRAVIFETDSVTGFHDFGHDLMDELSVG